MRVEQAIYLLLVLNILAKVADAVTTKLAIQLNKGYEKNAIVRRVMVDIGVNTTLIILTGYVILGILLLYFSYEVLKQSANTDIELSIMQGSVILTYLIMFIYTSVIALGNTLVIIS